MTFESLHTFISENTHKVEDFLIWEPKGELKKMMNMLNAIKAHPNELYRGMSLEEFQNMKNNFIQSDARDVCSSKGGTYLTHIPAIAGRFVLVNKRDTGNAVLVILDKNKIPDLEQRNDWDWAAPCIPKDAIKRAIKF